MKHFIIILLAIINIQTTYGKEHYEKKDFGNFLLHSDFVENKAYSDGEKFFYVARSDNGKVGFVNNISIIQGRNKYTMAQHEQFRDVILKQLAWQCQNTDAQIFGDGRQTHNGYIVYTFKIVKPNEITTFFYIIHKDNAYIQIQETTRGDAKLTDEATLMMVNTFYNN